MQKYYTRTFERSLPGQLVGNGAPARVRSLRNAADIRAQTATFEVTGAGTGAGDYTIVIPTNGLAAADYTITFSLPAAHSIEELVQAAILNINIKDELYQDFLFATKDPANANQVLLTGLQKSVDWSAGPIVVTPAGAGPGTFGAPNIVNSGVATPIGYGLFVGRDASLGHTGDNAALPIDGAANWLPVGVTMTTQFEEKDRLGPDAVTEYKVGDWMDIVTDTRPLKGIECVCVESVLTEGTPLFVSNTAGTLGWVTSVNTGLALPNAKIEAEVYNNAIVGKNIVTLSLN